MKKSFLSSGLVCLGILLSGSPALADDLRFDPHSYSEASLTMPNGEIVHYKAYENISYVGNPEDSSFQNLNLYVPVDLKGRQDKDIPILMRNNVGGYMASPPGTPSPTDATGRALGGICGLYSRRQGQWFDCRPEWKTG